jgi:hypothetical protein
MKFSSLLIACLSISTVLTGELDEQDFSHIQTRSFDYYTEKHNKGIMGKCAVNEMAAYQLSADADSLSEPNSICPQMASNCCGKETQERIKVLWEKDVEHQAAYHGAHLKIHKYILGNGKNYEILANDIIKASHKIRKSRNLNQPNQAANANLIDQSSDQYNFEYHRKCENTAKKFVRLNYINREKAKGMYEGLTRRAEFMQNARAGFYCMLCHGNEGDGIYTMRLFIKSRIYFDKTFCQMIFKETFPAIYNIKRGYNQYIKYLLKMLTCIKPKNAINSDARNNQSRGTNPNLNTVDVHTPLYEMLNYKNRNPYAHLDKDDREMFKNPLKTSHAFAIEACYNVDPESVFFRLRCSSFCQRFKMTKRSKYLDGDVKTLYIIFKRLEKSEFALVAPNNGIFDEDIPAIKGDIELKNKFIRNYITFYRPLNSLHDISRFKTVFSWFIKGVNPMEMAKGSDLFFKYKSACLLNTVVLIAFVFLTSLWRN